MFEVFVISLLSSVAETPLTPPQIVFPEDCKCAIVFKEAERTYADPNFDADLYPDYIVNSLEKGRINYPVFEVGFTENTLIGPNPINAPLQ